jgi:hypothetical protein
MKYTAQSVMIGRKPREGDDEFKTATVSLFAKNNPHLHGEAPLKTMDFRNVEKVRLRDLVNISYYTEGNDLVVNNLKEVEIEQDGSIVTITGRQEIPDKSPMKRK